MHISPKEAFSVLEDWRNRRIALRVHLPGQAQPVNSTIREIEGAVVRLGSDPETLQIDLHGADFNGDARTEYSGHGAYLVCEFRNGNRYSFYVQSS
jgi:hypothetical protein